MKRAVAALSLGILVLVSSGPLAYAGTLTDLNAQLASLNINASEIAVPCNTATNQSSADVAAVNTLRQTLVTDEANPIADSISKDLQALAAAVTQQESDESLMLSACTPVKLNQIDINEVEDKLARISALPSNPTDIMMAAAANGTFTFGQRCDWSPSVINGAYIQMLDMDGSWSTVPSILGSYTYPNCNSTYGFGHWAIINLSPGTQYRWVLPAFSPAFTEPTLTMQDYLSQYSKQKQQIISDAHDAKSSYTSVWDLALAKDIQSSVSVVAPLVTSLDFQIKAQAAKYPQNAAPYQKIVTAEPVAPAFSSDNSADLAAATTYLATVSAFQTSVPAQLQKLIPKPLTIQCVKGTKSKKVTGIAPKCPTGFKLRK